MRGVRGQGRREYNLIAKLAFPYLQLSTVFLPLLPQIIFYFKDFYFVTQYFITDMGKLKHTGNPEQKQRLLCELLILFLELKHDITFRMMIQPMFFFAKIYYKCYQFYSIKYGITYNDYYFPDIYQKTIYCHQAKCDVQVAVILNNHREFVCIKQTSILNQLSRGYCP